MLQRAAPAIFPCIGITVLSGHTVNRKAHSPVTPVSWPDLDSPRARPPSALHYPRFSRHRPRLIARALRDWSVARFVSRNAFTADDNDNDDDAHCCSLGRAPGTSAMVYFSHPCVLPSLASRIFTDALSVRYLSARYFMSRVRVRKRRVSMPSRRAPSAPSCTSFRHLLRFCSRRRRRAARTKRRTARMSTPLTRWGYIISLSVCHCSFGPILRLVSSWIVNIYGRSVLLCARRMCIYTLKCVPIRQTRRVLFRKNVFNEFRCDRSVAWPTRHLAFFTYYLFAVRYKHVGRNVHRLRYLVCVFTYSSLYSVHLSKDSIILINKFIAGNYSISMGKISYVIVLVIKGV